MSSVKPEKARISKHKNHKVKTNTLYNTIYHHYKHVFVVIVHELLQKLALSSGV